MQYNRIIVSVVHNIQHEVISIGTQAKSGFQFSGIATALATPTPQPMSTVTLIRDRKPVEPFRISDLALPDIRSKPPCPISTLTDDSHPGRSESIVISDLHAPGMREDLLLYIAKKHAGARLVILGDIFHNDKMSRFAKRKFAKSRSTEDDMKMDSIVESTVATLRRVSVFFEDMVILRGNHDERLANSIAAMADGGDASLVDHLYRMVFEDNIQNCKVTHGTGRAVQMLKRGDAYMGHFARYGIPKMAGAVKVIEWLLDDAEVAAAGPWNVLIQAHTHKLGKVLHKRKLAMESGTLTTVPDYYDNKLGVHTVPQLGYIRLVQDDGWTDFLDTEVKFFPLHLYTEYMEIGGFGGQVYGSHNTD